ncbi:MAG: 5'-nucleotidase [Oscillospiraceae bacterium]|nr:5'-nucleotidase [Oscillospiraceae bacterium]
MRIFVDMDGTLARFHDEVGYLERMYEKGFFSGLKPFQQAVQAIKELACDSNDYEIFILSATVDGEPPYCCDEKNQWLDRYCPEIDQAHRLFTRIGVPKSEYIPGGIQSDDILWDDYNKNLEEWDSDGGIAVKCKNNINHKGLRGPIWQGLVVENDISAESIKNAFSEIVCEVAQSSDEEWEM